MTEAVHGKIQYAFQARKLPDVRVKWRDRPVKIREVAE